MSFSDLDHVSANGKRKYCDEQGCSEETDHLSLIKCFRHSGRFHRNQRCNIAGCDNWVLSNRRCEVHGGVAKHCTHGKLKGGCNECGVGDTLEQTRKDIKNEYMKALSKSNKYRYLCPNCKDWPDGRKGRKGYDGYCATCFKFLFPQDPRVKSYGFKEAQTKAFIDKHFQDFRHNKYIETAHPCDCTKRRRIDHRRCIGNTLICVETDERAHEGYSVQDERDRYHDAIMDWGGKLVFIRFNPDGKGFTMDEKHARLAAEINEQVRRVEAEENTELCERVYLFYPATSRFIAAQ